MKNGTIFRARAQLYRVSSSQVRQGTKNAAPAQPERLKLVCVAQFNPLTMEYERQLVLVPHAKRLARPTRPN